MAESLDMLVLCGVIYGEGSVDWAGSFATATQIVFFAIVAAAPYLLGLGRRPDKRVALSLAPTAPFFRLITTGFLKGNRL